MILSKKIVLYGSIFAAIIVSSVIICNRVFSYNDTITHPSLTDNVAKIYNANFDRKLNNEEIDWLREGSIKEDLAPRWLSHFYNPENGMGLGSMMNSKDWAQSPNYQALSAFTFSGGNQTWQKAIDSYVKGNNQEAFFALGHVLHLLEDATVPAHTRLDAHPTGDPYEQWTFNNIGSSINFNVSPATIDDINAAFDVVASYSSNNFLSKNTVEKEKERVLGLKTVAVFDNNKNIDCYLSHDDKGDEFCIASSDKNFVNTSKKVLYLTNKNHSDYFFLLAPKAVSYGAGAVKLFFDEAEKAKKEYENKNWWQKLKDKANQLLANVGPLYAGVMVENAPSEAPPVGGANEAPEEAPESLPSAPPTPPAAPLPPNIVAAEERIETQLPADAVAAQEKLGGDIIEETLPQDNAIPPAIIEEIVPSQATPPDPSPLISASGGGSAPAAISTSTPDTTPPEATIISQPESLASSTTAIFEFSSSESGSTFSCQIDNASSTDCSSPQEYDNLAEGGHIFKVSAADAAGNHNATSTEYSWTIDLAPAVVVSLSNYDSMSIDFMVAWSSSSTDINYYDAQYKIGEQGIWRDWVMATAETSKSFRAGHDDVIYYFRVRAIDAAGQTGAWQEIQALISQKPIIFNEIMFDPGPGADSYYEYVELYNRSPLAVDLAGWKFISNGHEHIISADTIHNGSSTTIISGGFALLADKAAVANASSTYDGYYSIPDYSSSTLRLRVDDASLDLVNASNNLILKNVAGSTVDSVTYANNWGDVNDSGRSLERINYNNIYSDFVVAWGTSVVGGTPNAQSSVLDISAGSPIRDNTLISGNALWSKTGSPYILYASNNNIYPTVAAGATLTIEPGTIIKSLNKIYYSLYVKGTIKAVGTGEEPILFTSSSAAPQAGDWGTGIYFAPEALNSELSFVTFEYGGYQLPFGDPSPAVVVNGANVDINNCLWRDIQSRGLDLIGSDSTLADSRFLANGLAVRLTGSSTPTVKNNVFQNSGNVGTAITLEDQSRPLIESNNISGFQFAVRLENSYPDFSGNSLSNNSFNGVSVSERTVLTKDATWQQGIVYILRSDIATQYPTVAAGATLTIEPGATIKTTSWTYTALKINGILMADGQATSTLINFTSFEDDSVGGDTNNDGSASQPSAENGEWKNVIFADGSQVTLKFIKFSYGGYSRDRTSYLYYNGPILTIETGAAVTQENVTVE